MEGIILAGGLGTRLQSVVSDVPKCMAQVAGKPFLHHLLTSLETAGFTHVILSLGYKYEIVQSWATAFDTSLKISCVVENEPLGTGGAVKLAIRQAVEEAVFVLNGDTFFAVDFQHMLEQHRQRKATATLALRKMHRFDRYGIVRLEGDHVRIAGFCEKQYCESGLINGGTYLLARHALDSLPDKFSLEKDYFEKNTASQQIDGFVSDGYFIDIGIPQDYAKAQTDFTNGSMQTTF